MYLRRRHQPTAKVLRPAYPASGTRQGSHRQTDNRLPCHKQNRRIIIFTDSLSNYNSLITNPNDDEKLACPILYRNTLEKLRTKKALLWKVKSHTNPQNYFNYKADLLADRGRLHPNNNNQIIPTYNSNQYSETNIFHCPERDPVKYLARQRVPELRVSLELAHDTWPG